MMLRIAEKRQSYHHCSWLVVIVIFFLIFPTIFLLGGGYHNGIGYVFLLAFVFTAFLLDGREKVFALVVEICLYVACYIAFYVNPEVSIIPDTEQNHFIFSISVFAVTSIILSFVLLLRNRIVKNWQREIINLNAELTNRNEELAQYDEMKNEFLATVSHEVNTPLAIIAASSSDTLDLLNEESLNKEEIVENQEIIQKRVKLIDNIITDLIDTVAIEKGRLTLSREPVDLATHIEEICGSQHKLLDVNNNCIVFDLPAGLPMLWVDKLRIDQVLTNLLSNAFRHTKSGVITIKLAKAGSKQTVSVADNGVGMDAEMARIALRKYVSTKSDHWRHGIGLYLCRQIIAAHHGEIWINSEKGQGTTVSFSIQEGVFT